MTLSLDTLNLAKGSHETRDDGVCVMEAVAWLAGEEHSDMPLCASPVITRFAMGLNDAWDDEQRQRLIPYTKLIVNTRDGLDEQRGLMAADWLIRTWTPAWLHLAGLHEIAETLESHPVLSDWAAVIELSRTELASAREQAAAARAAAGAAAGPAARAAAWAAAWAAGAAAGAAARAAAWAAGAAAGPAARATAAWATTAAARDVLQPTTHRLQDSALDLLDRMCRLGTSREERVV